MSQIVDIVRGSKLHQVISAVYPVYRKKKAILVIYDTPVKQIQTSLGGWDGGSRDYDDILDMTTNPRVSPAPQKAAFVNENTNPVMTIDEYHAKVTTGTFCGKTATMSICCTKAFFDRFLQ